MLKRLVLAVIQFFAFAFLLGVGGYWDIVRLVLQLRPGFKWLVNLFPLLRFQVTANHVLIANGILFAGILCALILILEAVRKASRSAMLTTVLTYVFAVVISLMLKVGLPPVS